MSRRRAAREIAAGPPAPARECGACAGRPRGAGARRPMDEAGQSTTEYLVITGVVASIAMVVVNQLTGSVREILRTVALRILSVVTGS